MKSTQTENHRSVLGHIVLVATPILLLAIVLVVFSRVNPLVGLTGGQPPVEELNVDRVLLDDDGFLLYVTNSGPSAVTVSQVTVDDAFWMFSMSPDGRLDRLERTEIRIPYHWVEGEAHEIVVLTSTGATFSHSVEVAVLSPVPDAKRWLLLAAIGFLVGVVPVGLGLMWFPFLRRLSSPALQFVRP